MSFDLKKKATLKKLDYYLENQEVDPPAIPIIQYINMHPDLFTTSSCSGRVLVLIDREKKIDSEKYLTFHRKISLEDLKDLPEDSILRVEPFIFHIEARDIDIASEFLQRARLVGIKRGGMTKVKIGYFIEIMGNVCFSAPVKNLIIDESLIKHINMLMTRNEKMLNRFYNSIRIWIENLVKNANKSLK